MIESYQPRDIVLAELPITSREERRRRPNLVLADTGDLDIVVARMTSALPRDQFDVEVIDRLTAGLLLPSMTRTHKLVTVEKRTVERRLGMLSEADWARVQESIERLLIRR